MVYVYGTGTMLRRNYSHLFIVYADSLHLRILQYAAIVFCNLVFFVFSAGPSPLNTRWVLSPLTGRWGRDKGKGKGYSSGQKRPGDFCVNKLCHFSLRNSRGDHSQGLGMEEVMMIPWKRRFVVRSDIDESCLASPSGTNRMGKYSVHRLHHQDCKEYY